MTRVIRPATAGDAAACAAIYEPYVNDTAITFETEPPSVAAMAERIAIATRQHAWLVLEDDIAGAPTVLGYAYASAFHPRAAYRWSCETSLYLDQAHRGRGGGRALYEALLETLTRRGYRRAVALIALPNEPSLSLHRSMGYTDVGTHRQIGWKHGAWRDVTWLQRDLAPEADLGQAPAEIV